MSAVWITGIAPAAEARPAPREADFIVTSSAEIDVCREPEACAIIEAVRPAGARSAEVVSVGCAGVFAAILAFARSGRPRARVLALEAPAPFVQATLDWAGMGAGRDGFVAQEVAWTLDLSRRPEGLALRVAHCEILARPDGLGGTGRLAATLARRLAALDAALPGAALVTFENCSPWAQRLMQLARGQSGRGLSDPALWLPTIESDARHYMTARPLMDIAANLADAPLAVATLGAGGRLGLLAVAPGAAGPCGCAAPSLEDFGDAPLRAPRATPGPVRYMDRRWFGRPDFFFRWRLLIEEFEHA